MYIFLHQGHHMRPKILKQHVAGIEMSSLFDLKKDHAVFTFDVSWYNQQTVCEVTRPGNTYVQGLSGIESPWNVVLMWIQTVWNFDMGVDREGVGGRGPRAPLENYKLSCIS